MDLRPKLGVGLVKLIDLVIEFISSIFRSGFLNGVHLLIDVIKAVLQGCLVKNIPCVLKYILVSLEYCSGLRDLEVSSG
jgi:hypothetical protein